MAFQVLVFRPRSEEVVVAYEGKLAETVFPEWGFRVPTLFRGSTVRSGRTALNIAPVVFLDKEEIFPPGFMRGIPQGPRDFFANAANLR